VEATEKLPAALDTELAPNENNPLPPPKEGATEAPLEPTLVPEVNENIWAVAAVEEEGSAFLAFAVPLFPGSAVELLPLGTAPNEKQGAALVAPTAAGWIAPDDIADDAVPTDDPAPLNVKVGATGVDPPNEKDGAETDATAELDAAAAKENKDVFGGSADFDESNVGMTEVEGAGADKSLSSSSSSLLPEASRPTSTFLSGHWNLVGTPAFRASAFFCSSRSFAFLPSSAPRPLPTPLSPPPTPPALVWATPAPATAAVKPKDKLAEDDSELPVVNPKVEGLPPDPDTAGIEKEGADVPFAAAESNLKAAALELADPAPKLKVGAFDFDASDPEERKSPLDALAPNKGALNLFPSAPTSAAFESTPNLNPTLVPEVSAPNLNPCVAVDCAPEGAAPKMKPPCEAAAVVAPNKN
jgi:hypothetical protein